MKNLFINNDSKFRSGWKILVTFFMVLFFSGVFQILPYIFFIKANNSTFKLLAFSISNFLSFGIIVIFIWKISEKKGVKELGLKVEKKFIGHFFIGFFMGMISIILIVIILVLKNDIIIEKNFEGFNSIFFNLVILFIAFVLIGLSEEIFFRGYIISTLKQTRNKHIVLYVSSILFGMAHLLNSNINIIGVFNIIFVGVLFSVMTLKTDNLWMAIGYHITWNYFQGPVFGFEVSGNQTESLLKSTFKTGNIINGGNFGLEGGILTSLIILLLLIVINFLYKRKITI